MERENMLAFIGRFAEAKHLFMHGMCYWFAAILRARFHCGIIVYDLDEGHFMLRHGGCCYDVEGEHDIPENAKSLSAIRRDNRVLYNRLWHDCINKDPYPDAIDAESIQGMRFEVKEDGAYEK